MNWPDLTYSLSPTWPSWLPEAAALPTFLGAAALLALVTFWTYLGQRGASLGRIIVVLLLRLAALVVALLVALRPSLGVQVLEGLEPSKLLVVVDFSKSMTIPDGFNSAPRWDDVRRILASRQVVDALKRLSADEQIEVVYYQGAGELTAFDPKGDATGERTDIGGWLHDLHVKHAGQDKLRGVLIFSDGSDNGTRFPVLDEAHKWRNVCRIYTFGVGKPQEDSDRKDIIVASIKADSPVPAKTKLSVKGVVHALGFKDVVVKVELWSQGSQDKEPKLLGEAETVTLKDERNNEITLVRDAPAIPDEYKLTLKVEKVEGEADVTNNEASTYVRVTKEGVVVLWVEGRKRAWEPAFAQRALATDKRFNVEPWEGDGRALVAPNPRLYDVIVIGDLSAQQFSGGDPRILEKVRELVLEKKVGLMMLGGIDTFGRGGWDASPIADLLPVKFDITAQIDKAVRMRPTEATINQFPFFKLDDDPTKNRELWDKKLPPLDGMAQLGEIRNKATATILAKGNDDDLLMVAGVPGGRVLVFGGDSTWKWPRTPQTLAAYNKFWRGAMLWLANQDEHAGNLWIDIDPKTRRLNAGSPERLEFTFGLKGKVEEIPTAQFKVRAIGPKGEVINVPRSTPEKKHQRGTLAAPATPGEYLLEVEGKGKDTDGTEVSDKKAVHFLVVSENLELQRKAADHDLLRDIATKSGGRFDHAGEGAVLKLLSELKGEARRESHAKTVRWPDWDRHPATETIPDQLAGIWGSSALIWLLAFAALLGCEWGLRRKWGMV